MLRRQIDVMHETAAIDDHARQIEEDYKFHRMICEIAGSKRLLRLFDDLASELRMTIGLIGRLYDDPHRIAQTHEALLEVLEQGHPDIITARIDYHIGAAWREVGKLVRELPSSTNGAAT
jgi:DNA-binding FadR family transcriptional regulator